VMEAAHGRGDLPMPRSKHDSSSLRRHAELLVSRLSRPIRRLLLSTFACLKAGQLGKGVTRSSVKIKRRTLHQSRIHVSNRRNSASLSSRLPRGI
jgi:hypothetical protein